MATRAGDESSDCSSFEHFQDWGDRGRRASDSSGDFVAGSDGYQTMDETAANGSEEERASSPLLTTQPGAAARDHGRQPVVGGARLAADAPSPSAKSTEAKQGELPIFEERWAGRESAVTGAQHWANGRSKKLVIYKKGSGGKRVVLVCPARLVKPEGAKTATIDAGVACGAQMALLRSKAKSKAAAPWFLSKGASKVDHTSCGQDAGMATARVARRLAGFAGALAADKGATKGTLQAALTAGGIRMSKPAMYRAKTAVIDEDSKTHAGKFQLLEPFVDEFNKAAVNGKGEVRFDEGSRFSGVTLVSRGNCDLVMAGPQHVSFIDMAHSKSNLCRGQHFAMVGCDAGNKVTVMGWGLRPIESAAEYVKHLAVMLEMEPAADGDGDLNAWLKSPDHTQFAGRAKGIPMAQQMAYPDAKRMACTKHLITNARADPKVSNKFTGGMVWAIQGQMTEEGYNAAFEKLEKSPPAAATYFRSIEPGLWCLWPQVLAGRPLRGHKTNNFVESRNSWLLEARSGGPLGAADKVCAKVMSELTSRRKEAKKRFDEGHILTRFAESKHEEESIKAPLHDAQLPTDTLGYATGAQGAGEKRRAVDLANKTCSCNYWAQHKRPCRHAIAVAKKAGLIEGPAG